MGAAKKWGHNKDEDKMHYSLNIVESEPSHDDEHLEDLSGGHTKKGEEGEGPWLVSYADMMTLLMGFFALISSFSKPDAKEFDKVAAASSKVFLVVSMKLLMPCLSGSKRGLLFAKSF